MTDINSTVYLAQTPNPTNTGWTPDFSHASKYGKIIPVFDASDRPSLGHKRLISKAYDVLKNVKETDYICHVPCDNCSLLIIGYVLAELGLKKINFLRYERERNVEGNKVKNRGFYLPSVVELFN